MSNKKQQSSKKKHEQSDYVGGGVFSINKSRTSIWTKIVLIFLAVSMVLGTSAGLVSLIMGAGEAASSNSASLSDTITNINSTYGAEVKTAQAEVDKDPKNSDLYTTLGNTYFDWANQLQTALSGAEDLSSIDTTATYTQLSDAWTGAKDAYKKAIELNAVLDPNVKTDYSFALYYSGEATTSAQVAQEVVKEEPDFSMAWLSLGESYAALGENAKAIEAYEKYVKLAQGETSASQNVDYAKSQIESLKKADSGTDTNN